MKKPRKNTKNWIKTGSGFQAQVAVERKFPNRNPEVMDWFRLWFRESGNFARERKGNVSTVGMDVNVPGTGRSEMHISHPFMSFSSTFAFCLHAFKLFICFAIRE